MASALLAAVAVMVGTATWIVWRGEYPDHAQQLSVSLGDINARAGEIQDVDGGIRLVPDRQGMVVALFDSAPWFPAFQFHNVSVAIADPAQVRASNFLWASREAPQETHSLPLARDGNMLRANLGTNPDWRGRINGIGIAVVTGKPVNVRAVTLHPPEPTLKYLIKRIWWEWYYREGYHGSTINGLRGAGQATLLPIGVAGGLALTIGLVMLCLVCRPRPSWSSAQRPAILAAVITLWVLTAMPWAREVWAEALWAVKTYGGKNETQRKLQEPDSRLYALAQKVKDTIPPPPQRIYVLSMGETGAKDFERTKLHYYLAPHNVLSAYRQLRPITKGIISAGDYVLILDRHHPSFKFSDGKIKPGYPVKMLFEWQGARLFRIESSADD